jgi:tetratricopeptide (TPR) repeat protein
MITGVCASVEACCRPPTGSLVGQVFSALALLACLCGAVVADEYKATDYLLRGVQFAEKGDLDMAIRHYNEALRRDPKLSLAYIKRGDARGARGEHEKAIKDYAEAGKLDPRNPIIYNNLAWLQATCPDERIRDGKKAFANAKRACELTEWKAASCFDTLAGAYAESGDFPHAIQWVEKAIAGTNSAAEKQEMTRHLAAYQAGKPYREAVCQPPSRPANAPAGK